MTVRGLFRPWRRWLAGIVVAGSVVLAAVMAPDFLRELDAFRVQQVEVSGSRFLEPYAAVEAAGIGEASSVFDDVRAWQAGILALPLVEEVTVRRRLPSTILIEVREVEPVALVAGEELVPVDWRGRALALEPAGVVLDLPIVTGAELVDGQLRGQAAESALQLLSLLHERHPQWANRVSQLEVMATGVRIVFRGDGPDALVPLDPTPRHLTQLRLAYADLSARGELGRARRIDVRFRDQVVVSFLRSPLS
jgi:hypothetical protein